jgi:putative spermidine/putrescine transport system substrate-binding protein
MPISAGTLLFAYNTKEFPTAPTGWADFFDVQKFPGKRAVWNFVQNGLLEAALLADGVPPDKLYPLDLDRAFKKLDSIKDKLNWVQSPGALTEALVNGEANIALSFSGRAYQAAKQGAPVAQVLNQQIVYWDAFGVVKGTKNLAAAQAFINFIATPEAQARYTELTGYGSTNVKASPQVDELAASFLPFNKATESTQVLLSQSWWAENFDSVNQQFVDWQSK